MSKEIFLYSENKKYKCGIELAESTDRFGCPSHSKIVLFEEREDGTYVIAEARDMLLETQKDKQIAKLKAENEIKQATIDYMAKDNKIIQDLILNLHQQLKDNTKQVCEKIRKWTKNQIVYCGGKATREDMIMSTAYNECLYDLREFLDQIENEKN